VNASTGDTDSFHSNLTFFLIIEISNLSRLLQLTINMFQSREKTILDLSRLGFIAFRALTGKYIIKRSKMGENVGET